MKLSDDQIQAKLNGMDGWAREGDAIHKTYQLPSFPAAVMFVGTVGHLAEAADHHPDILLQWRNVTITLSTHSAGGVTDKDFDLAAQIDGLPFKS